MAANDLYILPKDVRVIPVAELGEHTRSKFVYDENDYVIIYQHSRIPSKVIGEGVASLLNEFRDPKSLVQAIFNYSVAHELDPQETLDQSYSFLTKLRKDGYLIPYSEDADNDGNYRELLSPGDSFNGYEVVEKIQGLSDTQVFKVRDQQGRTFALKVLLSATTPNHQSAIPNNPTASPNHLTTQFQNEITTLLHLDGKVNPALIDNGQYQGHAYILQEWCDGLPCMLAAEQYRPLSKPGNLAGIMEMANNILLAYIHLHAQGVIHSDIHPGNVIVSPDNTVKIIDYGLARSGTPAKGQQRGGMGFFFEPEYAEAIRSGAPLPYSSFEGEQYGLAALIYMLFTGQPYLPFSFEKDELFRQIAEDAPLPFSKFDLDIDPQIENVILKALSKDPEDRFPSVAAFAEKFTTPPASPHPTSHNDPVTNLIKKFGWGSRTIEQGLHQSPTCSVNYGAAGIAYMLYRMACMTNDPHLLTAADIWINHAKAYLKDRETAFYSKEMDINPTTVGNSSIYHTASGVQLVQSLISYAMGDYYSLNDALIKYLTEMSTPCDNIDLALGKSGMLLGCALIRENIPMDAFPAMTDEYNKAGDKLLDDIWAQLETNPSVAYYGIAHGWAGFLYATARWATATGRALPTGFDARVDRLMDCALTEGKKTRWPLTPQENISWPGWCHGSAGYTFLLTSLYKMTGNEKYIETAESAARHFCADTATTNGSLCCGLSGEAYALLNLYKITSAPAWLKHARLLKDRVQKHIHAPSMRPNSLYKGDIGAGLLLAEIEHPALARMPLFE